MRNNYENNATTEFRKTAKNRFSKKNDVVLKPNEIMQSRRQCEPHMCTEFNRNPNATTQFQDNNPTKLFHDEMDMLISHKFHGQAFRDLDKKSRRKSSSAASSRGTMGSATKTLAGGSAVTSSSGSATKSRRKSSSSSTRGTVGSTGDAKSSKSSSKSAGGGSVNSGEGSQKVSSKASTAEGSVSTGKSSGGGMSKKSGSKKSASSSSEGIFLLQLKEIQ